MATIARLLDVRRPVQDRYGVVRWVRAGDVLAEQKAERDRKAYEIGARELERKELASNAGVNARRSRSRTLAERITAAAVAYRRSHSSTSQRQMAASIARKLRVNENTVRRILRQHNVR